MCVESTRNVKTNHITSLNDLLFSTPLLVANMLELPIISLWKSILYGSPHDGFHMYILGYYNQDNIMDSPGHLNNILFSTSIVVGKMLPIIYLFVSPKMDYPGPLSLLESRQHCPLYIISCMLTVCHTWLMWRIGVFGSWNVLPILNCAMIAVRHLHNKFHSDYITNHLSI